MISQRLFPSHLSVLLAHYRIVKLLFMNELCRGSTFALWSAVYLKFMSCLLKLIIVEGNKKPCGPFRDIVVIWSA